MSGTVLLTLGRMPKALEVARSFARAGWRVVVAEPFDWHLSRVSTAVARSVKVRAPNADHRGYLEDMAAAIAREKVDLVVPVSEEAMHAAALKPMLPPGVRFLGMDQATLLTLHDKLNFVRVAEGMGLDVPATHRLDAPEAPALAETQDVVVKPLLSCSGIGVSFLGRGSPLPPPSERLLVQARVHGPVCSTYTLAHAGRVLVTVVYRGTIMSGTVAVGFERIEQPAVTAWAQAFVARSGWSGSISFDFVLDGEGRAFAIECNPRLTSGVHFVHPDDLAGAMIDPERATTLRFKDAGLLQQFYPALTETQASLLFRRERFRRNLGYLLKSRDVTWGWRDPLPLLLQPFTSWRILKKSMTEGLSFGEAATEDIGWFAMPAAQG